MNKCLKVIFSVESLSGVLDDFVQKQARKFELEGVAQILEGQEPMIQIIVCGDKDNVDAFIDELHKGTKKFMPKDIEIEPFLKSKDYRGVFRIIE